MVSRNLTEVFVLMRNNAVHSRQIFSEQSGDSERIRLMRRNSDRDLEGGALDHKVELHAPPHWADALEEAQYIITRLRSKISELKGKHEQQILRPTLDEGITEQHILRLTNEIGRHFNHAHRNVTAIKAQTQYGSSIQRKLTQNVVVALVTTLQELSHSFRTAQSNFLKSLTSREERSNAYFELPNFEELSLDDNADLLPSLTDNQTDLLFSFGPSTSGMQNDDQGNDAFQRPGLSQQQMMLIQEENTNMVAEREEEVNKIVRSIVDLNEVFKDLAHMVHDQGSVLDRIDYNIEQTQVQVHEGYQQLKKADMYQRKNRKMHCIFVLCITIISLFVLLVIVKS